MDIADLALARLPLHGLHVAQGARMAEFAGWDMPLHYPPGIMAEHLHTRAAASLFDVSHMGQVRLKGKAAAAALEALTPADLIGLAAGRQRYALLTDDAGGIRDDIMVAQLCDHLHLVVNASTREADVAYLREALVGIEVEEVTDRALLALQGPASEASLASLLPAVAAMRFMDAAVLDWDGVEVWVSRSGYTGEDGFEVSLPQTAAEAFADALLAQTSVRLAGLGARDSLRLEAGLCLYGQDIDRTTTPVEVALSWSIGRSRRSGGDREGGFPGAARILRELDHGPARLRVGLRPEGRAPMRAGTVISGPSGSVGHVTSGGFSPTLQAPIAMGRIEAGLAVSGTHLTGDVRGRAHLVTIVPLPFQPTSFKR